MSKAPAEPGCSIRVVVNRTGVAADTLRVWERRYGFPKPERRPGGSRIYSEDDVARLLLVQRALAAGYRPSEVVPLPRSELERITARDHTPEHAPPEGGAVTVDTVAEALAKDDLESVRRLLRTGALTLGPRRFVTDLAHPLAVRVGELWEAGTLEVRHEHLVTALLTTQLRLLFAALDEPARGPKVLLATLPGEAHAMALDMVAVVLAAAGASSSMLGADSPPNEILRAAEALHADAIGLSISSAADGTSVAKHVRAIVRGMEAARSRSELWIGGAGGGRVAIEAPHVRHIESWTELERALEALRSRRAA